MKKEDGRRNNGGHKTAGRKKGVGITFDIQRHCYDFMFDLLKNEAIKKKAIDQLSETLKDKNKPYLYILKSSGKYKIGYTIDWNKRKKGYKTHLPKYELILLLKLESAYDVERFIIEKYKSCRLNGEWFDFSYKNLVEIISYCSSIIENE